MWRSVEKKLRRQFVPLRSKKRSLYPGEDGYLGMDRCVELVLQKAEAGHIRQVGFKHAAINGLLAQMSSPDWPVAAWTTL